MFGAGKPSSHLVNVLVLLAGLALIGWLIDRDFKSEIRANREVSRRMLAEARENHNVVEENRDLLRFLVNAWPGKAPDAASRPAGKE